ncbi:MAG TPA: acyl carrier protein [Chloroflexota bacterium]|nr:acyl carrier protein [Chloroflexota bacterium]
MEVTVTDPQVLSDLVDMMSQLADDWEYSGEITESTYFIRDLGLESLDLVVLGAAIQERYGRLPFPEFLEEIGSRPASERDVSVGELVAFVSTNRGRA